MEAILPTSLTHEKSCYKIILQYLRIIAYLIHLESYKIRLNSFVEILFLDFLWGLLLRPQCLTLSQRKFLGSLIHHFSHGQAYVQCFLAFKIFRLNVKEYCYNFNLIWIVYIRCLTRFIKNHIGESKKKHSSYIMTVKCGGIYPSNI